MGALLPPTKSAFAQEFTFRTVALAGQPAPGTPEGVNYASFDPSPSLNTAGQCVFRATLFGAGVMSTNNRGIWSGSPGSVALLGRTGDPVPGMAAGVVYSDLGTGNLTVNAVGQSAFSARITGGVVFNSNDEGLWVGMPGSVALLAREGDHAPGTPAGAYYFSVFSNNALNVAGQSVFGGQLSGNGVNSLNFRGNWSGAPGSVALLARGGDQAPGMPPGCNYNPMFFTGPVGINAAGRSTFGAAACGFGVWIGAPGDVAPLAISGLPAPGTGANYDIPSRGPINAAGQSVFSSGLAGQGITSENNSGLWFGAPGSVALLVRKGNQAPGAPAGVTYAGVFEGAVLNGEAQSAFHAKLTGSGVTLMNDSGLWRGVPGSSANLVREGDPALAVGADKFFGDTISPPFALNDRSEVAFLNFLTGSGVSTANDGCLWISDTAGTLSLIVREGSPFEITPGDSRIINTLSFVGGSGDEDGLACGFNDRGQVAFLANFTDGSQGIFVATPALQLTSAVSRKTHESAGTFDVLLPLTGEPGVECRSSGGIHTLVFSFRNSLVSGKASVTTGTGVAGSPTFFENTMTVPLSGVADVQKVTVTLSNVTDEFAQVLPDSTVSMNLLIGDTNGSKNVNATDIGQTKGQVGITVTNANFRQDVTPNGTINASDIGLVKSRSGASVP